jgi:hypothetical protein
MGSRCAHKPGSVDAVDTLDRWPSTGPPGALAVRFVAGDRRLPVLRLRDAT